MKKILLMLSIQMGYMVSCAQSLTIETQKQLNTDFKKYKTYGFVSQVDQNLDEGYFFLNDLMLKTSIRNAVEGEMQNRGYRKSSASPDLLINFRVFEAATRIKAFEDDNIYWTGLEVRQPEDTTSYAILPGTLFISFIERNSSNIVWQGFASGLIDNNRFIKDEQKIKEAVNQIFKKYGYRAGR